ncbi:YcgL domain-containing protein [Parashewanella tropica]|uniref:YcgL domain-containing protein n=1 Tax=Parashewanella tropica TaxID=2547970 RepID=UPI0010593FD0|nr:YcgL domain-containing protein [Parashewanella tropica]
MICAVYKSSVKPETYLYVPKNGDFSQVPEPLLKMFGTPIFVMALPFVKVEKLALADIDTVKNDIEEKGFYLQLPPPTENLLEQHKKALGMEE